LVDSAESMMMRGLANPKKKAAREFSVCVGIEMLSLDEKFLQKLTIMK
jgi:hypothetical protein